MAIRPDGPSRWWYVVGAVLIVVGLGGAVAWVAVSVIGVGRAIGGGDRLAIPDSQRMALEARDYVVYYETEGAGDGGVPEFTVGVEPVETGPEVDVRRHTGRATYNIGDRHGTAVFAFTVERPGTYVVETRGTAPGAAVIGEGVVRGVLGVIGAVFGALALFGLGVGGGIGVLVWAAVRRSRAASGG